MSKMIPTGKISTRTRTVLLLLLISASSGLARTTRNPAFHRSNEAPSLIGTLDDDSIIDDELESISICINSIPFYLLKLRGGERYYDEDDYDSDGEYDDDQEEEGNDPFSKRRNSRPPPVSSRKPPGTRRPTPTYVPRSPDGNRQKKTKHWTHRMATQSLQMGSELAWNAVKTPGKLAYHLIRPKHVDLGETGGLWRIDQQVTTRGDKQMASVATVELDARRKLITVRHRPIANEGEDSDEDDNKGGDEDSKEPKEVVVRQPYTFTKSRLGSYKTSFVAPAFLVGDHPRMYGYKGTWQRKMADKKVIKLVGKIYEVRRQRFGRGRGSYQFTGKPVGTFVARRRVQLNEDDDDDDDDDGEYFADSSYDDEDQDYGEEEYDEDAYD